MHEILGLIPSTKIRERERDKDKKNDTERKGLNIIAMRIIF
jgi:hypothetical protein